MLYSFLPARGILARNRAGELPATPPLLSSRFWKVGSLITPAIASVHLEQGDSRNEAPDLKIEVILLNTISLGRELKFLL